MELVRVLLYVEICCMRGEDDTFEWDLLGERWRVTLISLTHWGRCIPPNQTGPVNHYICPFQHAHTHRLMDVLMEGSGF